MRIWGFHKFGVLLLGFLGFFRFGGCALFFFFARFGFVVLGFFCEICCGVVLQDLVVGRVFQDLGWVFL